MRFGVHLPLMDFGRQRFGVEHLVEYVGTATGVGFDAVSVNDHMVYGSPWLDGLTALAAVVSHTGDAGLFTTVANPVVRGPVSLAKALAAVDLLSGGRLVVGLGPGSSERDYATVGVPFTERWRRFDEAVSAVRALLRGQPFHGGHYALEETLTPLPAQTGGPPLWVGSWGSEAGLRRVARLGDGWLASAYNVTPTDFRARWQRVQHLVGEAGRDPEIIGNALATMWFHIDERRAGDVLEQRLTPVVRRPVAELRERLAFGPAGEVAEKLQAFSEAGVGRVFVWPVADDLEQLRRFGKQVLPRVTG